LIQPDEDDLTCSTIFAGAWFLQPSARAITLQAFGPQKLAVLRQMLRNAEFDVVSERLSPQKSLILKLVSTLPWLRISGEDERLLPEPQASIPRPQGCVYPHRASRGDRDHRHSCGDAPAGV